METTWSAESRETCTLPLSSVRADAQQYIPKWYACRRKFRQISNQDLNTENNILKNSSSLMEHPKNENQLGVHGWVSFEEKDTLHF